MNTIFSLMFNRYIVNQLTNFIYTSPYSMYFLSGLMFLIVVGYFVKLKRD